MRHKTLLTILLLLPWVALAGSEQTVTLKDGSQIKGELVGVNDGVYAIKSSTLGDIHIQKDQVTNISNNQAPVVVNAPETPALPSTNAMNGQIQEK